MSTRYRLPDELGGHPVTVVQPHVADSGMRDVIVQLDGESFPAALPMTLLVEVVPPLPPEPPVGSIVAAGYADNPLPIYRRWDEGWYAVGLQDGYSGWAEICALSMERAGVAPRLLVPAPEPVELPWRSEDGAVEVDAAVGCGCHGEEDGAHLIRVAMDTPAHLEAAQARAFGLVLVAAADAAEAQS